MWHLLSLDKCPPGEFRYEQAFNGKARRFGPSPVVGELAAKVADFRAGNGLPRATKAEALEDIDAFNCQRLGYSSRWCYNTDIPFTQIAAAVVPAPCATCGK